MNSFVKQIKGKKVLIFGLGLQGGGFGDALWLHSHGAIVKVTDQKSASLLSDSLSKLPPKITLTLGQHLDTDIEWADIIIKNPGVAVDQPQLLLATKLGKPIFTSIALVVEAAREKTIGITGTRGKTTITE
ncbi:MAG: UDP-N-acetylmuramoyl-L-alanine--D-glutamate ligase, partial [bacterium]